MTAVKVCPSWTLNHARKTLFKHRQVTDLDVTDLGFSGPRIPFRATGALWGDLSRLFLDHFCKHLCSVLGRTELCHEVRIPRPQTPRIIRNENHHLALLDLRHFLYDWALILATESREPTNSQGIMAVSIN